MFNCSPCLWASPLKGSWWRAQSRRRLSPATPSPSTRWDKRSLTTFQDLKVKNFKLDCLQAFTSQFHRVKIQQASARAGEAEPERNETRKKVKNFNQSETVFTEFLISLVAFFSIALPSRSTRTGSTRLRLALWELWRAGSSCNTISLSLRWAILRLDLICYGNSTHSWSLRWDKVPNANLECARLIQDMEYIWGYPTCYRNDIKLCYK